MAEPFPADWQTAVVMMPHPDDPEFGAAAVAKWTTGGKKVRYFLGCRGEMGIDGMAPEEAGPLREGEQRRAAAIVGVREVEFWDFPDGNIRNDAALRAKITDTFATLQPDLVVTVYGKSHWAPGVPNQIDHVEFSAAVMAAYDSLPDPPRWVFSVARDGTHAEIVDGFIDVAVESYAAHEKYLTVVDPETPAAEQARRMLEAVAPVRSETDGQRAIAFVLERSR